MFSWICPKCGAEVPPSYNECPNCAPPGDRPAAPPPPARPHAAPPPPPPRPAPVNPRPAPAARQATPIVEDPMEMRRPPKPAGVLFGGEAAPAPAGMPPPSYPAYPAPPAPSRGLPSWLLMLLVALVVGGIVAGAVWLKRRSSDTELTASEESPKAATAQTTGTHRFSKFIEVAGFRLSEDAKQRASLKMVVVNHSAADLSDLAMIVTLKTPEGKVVGTANVKANVGPLSSADVTAPLKTTERAYELPDWQFIRAEVEITSP